MALLAGAAVASLYFGRIGTVPEPAGIASEPSPPGYYLRDAVLLGTDDEGRVLYRIHAESAEERPEDGSLLLNGVEIEYQPNEQIPWRVRAARAEVEIDRSYLQLEGGVELEREPDADRAPTVVRTESLRFEPERHLAIAPGEVRFTVGNQSLAAVGLKAFLKDDRLELESKVHGRFVP